MLSKARAAIGALAVAAVVAAGSVAAAPQAQAGSGFYGAQVHQVGGKKNYWNNRYRNNYRPRYYNNGWNNNWWVGPAIGFGAGVLLGSALTAPRYYAPSAPTLLWRPQRLLRPEIPVLQSLFRDLHGLRRPPALLPDPVSTPRPDGNEKGPPPGRPFAFLR